MTPRIPSLTIKTIEPDAQEEVRKFIHQNCPANFRGEVTSSAEDLQKIQQIKSSFPSCSQGSTLYAYVLGAYIDNVLVGALNMNSYLYVFDGALNAAQVRLGMKMLCKGSSLGIYIDNISVASEYRGQGIGQALMDHAVKISHNLSLKYIALAATTPQAIEFFKKVGFTVCEDESLVSKLPAKIFDGCAPLALGKEEFSAGARYMLHEIKFEE